MATTASWVSPWTARMRAAMSLVALAARSASLRISSATTAKRTPDSPAPAASMAALSASRFVWGARASTVSTNSETSSERSPRLLMRLEMTCTSPRIRCMPARLSRTALSPRVAASSVWPAAVAAEAAFEATSCTERDIVSTSRLTVVASRACFSAPLAIWSVAPSMSLALPAQAGDGVVDGARELPELVVGADADGVREVAAADLLGHAHDLTQRACDPAREDGAGDHGQQRDTAEDGEEEPAGLGGGALDDRLVHAHANGAELAAEHRHADVDDRPHGPGDRVRVVDLTHLLGRLAGHEVLVDQVGRHHRVERVGDQRLLRVVDHDVRDAADRDKLVDERLHGRRVAVEDEVDAGRRQAVGDGGALRRELVGHPLAHGAHGHVPGDGGERDQHGRQEHDDLRQQAESHAHV